MNECEKIHNVKQSDLSCIHYSVQCDEDIDAYNLPSHILNDYNSMHSKNYNTNNATSESIINGIQLHGQRVLFYLNHANSSNYMLKTDIFHQIISTLFDYMLHNKLSLSNNENYSKWIHKYLNHIIYQQMRHHTESLESWKTELSKLLPLIFEGCLNRNLVDLSREIWQICEKNNILIDDASKKHYKNLSIRHFVRHGQRPPNPQNSEKQNVFETSDSDLQLSAFPGDNLSLRSKSPQPNEECLNLAKNLLDRSKHIAALMDVHSVNVPSYDNTDIVTAKQLEPGSTKSFLTDMENAITFCRKYNDIISGRMLFDAFISSKLSFKYHAAMATDFLFLLDHPQFRQFDSQNPLAITPEDVMTLWPLNCPQAFINKAFTILITCKHAEGIRKLFDSVILNRQQADNKRLLSLSPKMLILGSDLFAAECERAESLMNNLYWDYLWTLMESKEFKSARKSNSIAYIGNKILKIMFDCKNEKLTEDEMMENVKRIHETFKSYNLPLPLPLMQKLHSKLQNKLHQSWIRSVYIDEHHPNTSETDGMHIMNDYRWYIDAELFNKSMENGLYENLKPLRKLMIDGAIPVSHKLIHRILLTFSKSNSLSIADLRVFLIECQAHYQHALSPKEKSLIAQMVKRYMDNHNIRNFEDDPDVAAIASYLNSINVAINVNHHVHEERTKPFNSNKARESKPWLKHINEQSDIPMMSDSVRFEVGETVQLRCLEKYVYLNGSIGKVVGWFNKETRTYPVKLNGDDRIVYVPAKHMRFGKHIIDPTLPQFESMKLLESNQNDSVKLLIAQEPMVTKVEKKKEITPFDPKQKKQYLRNKLLHVFNDQEAVSLQNGISITRFKELWPLYFPEDKFYENDEKLHDYIVMQTPFEIDYGWNLTVNPSQRVYYLTQCIHQKRDWEKLSSVKEFLAYLRKLIGMQVNKRMRLKDLCKALYLDIHESHKLIRSCGCVHILHFLDRHHKKFNIDNVNGDKYISLRSNNDDSGYIDGECCDIYGVQYWLWKLPHQNISEFEWNNVLSLFEGHHIDGKALMSLNESDLAKMGITSVGIQKLILSAIHQPIVQIPSFESSTNTLDDLQAEEPLFTETDDCMRTISVDMGFEDVLTQHNFYNQVLQFHQRYPSEDNCIYQNDILEHFGMKDQHEWFVDLVINYHYDKFHINYYDDKMHLIKLNKRNESHLTDINDEELTEQLKRILHEHPIGIDIVSLLNEYESKHNGKMFKHNAKYEHLTDRLRALKFLITSSSFRCLVFDSYG